MPLRTPDSVIRTAAVVNSLSGSQTDQAPSVAAVKTSLDSKAASSHSHAIGDVTNLQTTLDGKASTSHSHAISDVTSLQTTLDGKASTSHSHAISDVTSLQTTLDGKASTSHSHAISDVTNLQTTLDSRLYYGVSILGTSTTYDGTNSAYTVEPCTVTFPSTGCYRIKVIASLRILVAATVTARLALGTAAVTHTNNDSLGSVYNTRSGSVVAAVYTTGSPNVISLTSRPDIANMTWTADLVLDVSTAGTLKLQFAQGGVAATGFTLLKGTKIMWEKIS